MQLIVYIALFIIFSPRYFFSFMKSSSGRIGFKEVVSHAAVFGFAVVVMQWVSKRYGVFEGFAKAAAGGTQNAITRGGRATTVSGPQNAAAGDVAGGAARVTTV